MKDYVVCNGCGINMDSDFAERYGDEWLCGKCAKDQKRFDAEMDDGEGGY